MATTAGYRVISSVQGYPDPSAGSHVVLKIYSRNAAHIPMERCVVVPAETSVSTVALMGFRQQDAEKDGLAEYLCCKLRNRVW